MENITQENKALARRIKQHIIAKEHEFLAIVQPGFEENSRIELGAIGIKTITKIIEGGIEFTGKLEDCYKVNIMSRTVNRVIMRIQKLRAENFNVLMKKSEKIPWELYINNNYPIKFNVTAKKSKLIHTGRIEEEVHKAIKNRLAEYHIPSSSDGSEPAGSHQTIFIRNENNKFHFSIDSTGELLYKRGVKTKVSTASLRETLAAQILLEAQIEKYDALLDPMCGSGTFPIEAAGIIKKSYAGINRNFSFMFWPGFKERSFDFLKKKLSKEGNIESNFKIYASDIDAENIKITLDNIMESGFEKMISVKKDNFFDGIIYLADNEKKLLVINPPYGARLNNINIKELYRKIGSTIKTHYQDWGYAIISPDLELEKIMALPYDRKTKFYNGGLKVAVIIKDNY